MGRWGVGVGAGFHFGTPRKPTPVGMGYRFVEGLRREEEEKKLPGLKTCLKALSTSFGLSFFSLLASTFSD
jgi:hypothetical protein